MSIDQLKNIFKNQSTLDLALTHKSWVNENPDKRRSNERLEFLGDAILEYVVSKELFKKYPEKEEGFLTALRANLVNTTNLAKVARNLEIGKSLHLSKGEEESGGRENKSLLANSVEAIIGALFVDGGLGPTQKFIEENLLNNLDEITSKPLKDAKSRLQEIIQSDNGHAPKYRVIDETGPDHNKKFTVEVLIGDKSIGQAQGKSKSEAEQEAAKIALGILSTE
jgi:ribonuclease-3